MMSAGMMGTAVRAAAAGITIIPALAAIVRCAAGIAGITADSAFCKNAVFVMYMAAV